MLAKILIVEDEQHLAFGIKYNLEAEGYEVLTASDGPTALKIVGDERRNGNECGFDLIILDIMLPGMSGYAVCEALRGSGVDIPILVLSARTLLEDRVRGYDVGADQYLQKPFELEELLSITRNLLARRGRAARSIQRDSEPQCQFGRAQVNFETFRVTVDGQPIRLTSTEMKLLRYFVENEGLVITRQQLLENVWGLSHMPVTRTVDNFIVNLRKYFELDPARPRHFLSVRGTGYQFIAHPSDQSGDAGTSEAGE